MQYEVKALRGAEGVVSLMLEAADENDAGVQATAQGYSVLSIRPRRGWGKVFGGKGADFLLLQFSQELLALLAAGLHLIEALETLCEKERNAETKKILQRVLESLYQGQTLSVALQQQRQAFPELYVATVRASEKTGDLRVALSRYVAYQSQLQLVRKKLVSASIYPVLLIVIGGLVTGFLLVYVVPRFSHVYEDIGGELPVFSRLLLGWGQLLEAHGQVMLMAVIGLGAALAYWLVRPAAKKRINEALWRVPAVGEHMRIYQLARLYRTLGMLLHGGTPIATALQMVSGLLNPTLQQKLVQARNAIREGRCISESFYEHGLTTPVAHRMLRVGERTGDMGQMMERIAGFYDEELARWVEWFTRLFEPLLMAAIGLVIGGIVVLMYLPIFELAGSLQ
ncbi:MAG: type II secretion system F family protein [Burkholderiales bacterium]